MFDAINGYHADHYKGGFRKIVAGVAHYSPTRRLPDGRYVNAKDSPRYNPLYDCPKHGISRLEKDPAKIEAAKAKLAEIEAKAATKAPRKPRQPAPIVAETVAPVEMAAEPVAHELAPEVAPMPAPVDLALYGRATRAEAVLARLGLRADAAAPVAANDDTPAPRRTEAERRAILRAWRMRCELRARADLDRRALLAVNEMNANLRAALGEAEASRDFYCAQTISDADTLAGLVAEVRTLSGQLHSVREAAAGAERRAARMVRAAGDYRKQARRAAEDLKDARAESRAFARRAEEARAAAAVAKARPAPAAPTNTAMAAAFAAAR